VIQSDKSLLHGCQAGDRQSWEKLVVRYERLLYGIALRSGLSEDDAADVFQTVCVRLIENLDKLHDDGHLKGWLITTAKHEAWRLHRQKRRYSDLQEPNIDDPCAPMDALPADDPLPLETIIHLEEEHMVRLAMEDLGDNCRVLLKLLYQIDPTPSYVQIARQMNISEGAIGPTRARCLQKLKKILQSKGF
jgi:RNA polymerase sigma factor (sigma-70 family)